MKWHNGIAYRFWMAMFSIMLAGIFSVGGIYLWTQSEQLEKALRHEGRTAANTLSSAIGLAMLKEEYTEISPLSYSLVEQPNFQYVIVRDLTGTVVNQKGQTITEQGLIKENVPIIYFQQPVGEVELGLKTDALKDQIRQLYFYTLLVALLMTLVSALLAYVLSRKLTSPLNKLLKATQQMTKGSRNIILHQEGMNEIQELSSSFNLMSVTIANQENILKEEIQKATQGLSEKIVTLEMMSDVSQCVMEKDYLRTEVIAIVLKRLQHFLHPDHLTLALCQNIDECMVHMYSLNAEEKLEERLMPILASPISLTIKSNQPMIRHNLMSESQFPQERSLREEGISSLLIVPLKARNHVIGTLNIGSREPDYYREKDIEQIQALVNPIAIAVDRAAAYESLQNSAFYDYLTGLPNNRSFMDLLNKALEEAKHQPDSIVAVMFLDLDRFKTINDTLGHNFGDLLLKRAAMELIQCLNGKGIVSRMGGDEFTILLTGIMDPKEVMDAAEMILQIFKRPWLLEGYEIPLTASIGISLFPKDGEQAETLIKCADMAMYKIKSKGKNGYHLYTPSAGDPTIERLTLENDLRKALENDEFIVCYQPKINVQLGQITGVEALVRWNHPKRGFISPVEFIPIAEETGFIAEMGEAVLRKACRQSAQWQRQGFPPITVSVNLSTRQFLQSNLSEMVAGILQETGLQPEWLELEITESMSVDIHHAIAVLNELKKLGVKISVDDFGTGYSSLNYIQRLPIDRLKIDRSFITDVTSNPHNAAMVSTIITMAANLGLEITAEGVETEDQTRFLQGQLCQEIQGFYFSKPLFAEELELHFTELQHQAGKWIHLPETITN